MGKYDDGIKKALDFLAARAEQYKKAVEKQAAAWHATAEEPVLLLSCGLTAEQEAWLPETFNPGEIHYDSDKMFINGLRSALCAANGGRESLPSIRANMGCGIVATLFGVEQELFDDKMPWVIRHLPREVLESMTEEYLFEGVEFEAAVSHMEYMNERLEGTGVPVYPLDIQGAFDTAHIVYGDDIFYDLYDDEDFTAHLFRLAEEAIFIAVDKCLDLLGDLPYIPHYNQFAIPRELGGIKLSEDTSTLVNADIIEKYIAPSIDRIYGRYGGGYIHYCGTNPHLFASCLDRPKAFGINFGNPDKHDMVQITGDIARAGKVYAGGLPMLEGEEYIEYFVRILKPAYYDGVFHIVPAFSCSVEQRDEVISAFDRAAERIRKGDASK